MGSGGTRGGKGRVLGVFVLPPDAGILYQVRPPGPKGRIWLIKRRMWEGGRKEEGGVKGGGGGKGGGGK